MSIADRITSRLETLGLSRRAASEKAKLSETFIRDVIEGRAKSPRMDSMAKLAAALETNVEWLRTGHGDPNMADPATAEVVSIMPSLDARRRAELAQFAKYLAEQSKRETGE